MSEKFGKACTNCSPCCVCAGDAYEEAEEYEAEIRALRTRLEQVQGELDRSKEEFRKFSAADALRKGLGV